MFWAKWCFPITPSFHTFLPHWLTYWIEPQGGWCRHAYRPVSRAHRPRKTSFNEFNVRNADQKFIENTSESCVNSGKCPLQSWVLNFSQFSEKDLQGFEEKFAWFSLLTLNSHDFLYSLWVWIEKLWERLRTTIECGLKKIEFKIRGKPLLCRFASLQLLSLVNKHTLSCYALQSSCCRTLFALLCRLFLLCKSHYHGAYCLFTVGCSLSTAPVVLSRILVVIVFLL